MSSQRTNESDIVDLTQVESSPSPPSNANRMVPDGDSDIEEVFIQDMAPNEESRRRNRELRRQRLLALGIDEGAESAQAPVLVVHPPAPEVIVISDNEDNEELNHPIIEAQEDLFGDERRRRRSRRDWHELEAPWPTGLDLYPETPVVPLNGPHIDFIPPAAPQGNFLGGGAFYRRGRPHGVSVQDMHRRAIQLDRERLEDRVRTHFDNLVAEQEAAYPGLFGGLVGALGRVGNTFNNLTGWGTAAWEGLGDGTEERHNRIVAPKEEPLNLPEAPEYKISFSHPGKMASGFTYDFEPDTITLEDSDSDSDAYDPQFDHEDSEAAQHRREKRRKRKGKEKAPAKSPTPAASKRTLAIVCSNCKDPLVIGGDDAHKLYGLRCGHVIDGRCLQKLGTPPDISQPLDAPKWTRDKGADQHFTNFPFTFSAPLTPRPPLVQEVPPRNHQDTTTVEGSIQPSIYEEIDDPVPTFVPTSTRSRLRSQREIVPTPNSSRRRAGLTQTSNGFQGSLDDIDESAPSGSSMYPAPSLDLTNPFFPAVSNLPSVASTTSTRGRRGRTGGTRRGRNRQADALGSHGLRTRKVPKTRGRLKEELFEWTCPVEGCGTSHLSVRLDVEGAKWKQDEEKGARVMFL